MPIIKQLALILALCLSSSLATADTVINYLNQKDKTQQLVIRDNQISTGPLLFDAVKKSITIFDHEKKSYIQIDRQALSRSGEVEADLKSMQEEMSAIFSQISTLENSAFKDEFKDETAPAQGSLTQLYKTRKSIKTKGYPCAIYKFSGNKKSKNSVCIAKAKHIGVPHKDFKTLVKMFDFMGGITLADSKLILQKNPLFGFNPQTFYGIPLLITDEKGATVIKIDSISQARNESKKSPFRIPAGYSRKPTLPEP